MKVALTRVAWCVIALAGLAPGVAFAQNRAELKERFESRYDALTKLKDQGRIGETWEGYVAPLLEELVGGEAAKLLEDENADRRRLYELIARDEKVTDGKKKPTPKQVAEVNAERNFKKALPNDHLLVSEGRWIQKKDEPRFKRLAKLKESGEVGETHEGLIAAVGGGQDDLINEENRERRKMYERLAKRSDLSQDKVIERLVKQTRQALPKGFYFQQSDGEWIRG